MPLPYLQLQPRDPAQNSFDMLGSGLRLYCVLKALQGGDLSNDHVS